RNLCSAHLLRCSGGTENDSPKRKPRAVMPERLFLCRCRSPAGYGKQMRPLTRQPFKARSTEELMALLSAVATAILAVIIISMLYFGRDIFVPVALAILLSFVLAPLVGILQRIHVPRGLAVVS